MESTIEYAERRLNEEIERYKSGAKNEHMIDYFHGVLDGAVMQLKEDAYHEHKN